MDLLNFSTPKLLHKYGSWARVQVAFYDFIFRQGSGMCSGCFKDKALSEVLEGFCDGGGVYEETVKAIEKIYPNPQDAWCAFMDEEAR